MKEITVRERRANICDEIDIAKDEVIYKNRQLKENLEDINKVLRIMKKTRKVISCLTYLKLNWYSDNCNEYQLKRAERELKSFSHLYEKTILERKILKAKLKQAQRKFSKKLKTIIRFDKKYFNENQ